MATPAPPPRALRRDLGVFSATMLGLGSIVGTGVFVSLGVAAGVAGAWVIVAVAVAALLALCNALSSAQLAASHPVAGGTYAYGYRYLTPSIGFTAGWLFLLAKSASAATAALGFAGYALRLVGGAEWNVQTPLGVTIVVIMTAIVLLGLRRASVTNTIIVAITLLTLLVFIVAGAWGVRDSTGLRLSLTTSGDSAFWRGLFEASALMFVAYTGYGRIATLGEEVREPRRTIPRAIVATIIVTAVLYLLVAIIAVETVGADALSALTRDTAAPLEVVAERFGVRGVPLIVSIGAVTAMLGVLLNLILGLSRVVLAMGRTGDLPRSAAAIHPRGDTPTVAVVLVGIGIAGLTMIGDVYTTWSFSAFTVLAYYAITNLAALRVDRADRRVPRVVSVIGLLGCLSLAFCVDRDVWIIGVALVVAGLLWHAVARRLTAPRPGGSTP